MIWKTAAEHMLAALVERGGVYHNIPGSSPREFLAALIKKLPPIPGIDPVELLGEIMEREALMSTGTGRGVALPHPRNPPLASIKEGAKPLVAIAFPAEPLDWNTQDGSKVHTVFLIVSESAKQHLGALSKISFLCQDETFYSLIKARAGKDEIIAAIEKAETAWAEKG